MMFRKTWGPPAYNFSLIRYQLHHLKFRDLFSWTAGVSPADARQRPVSSLPGETSTNSRQCRIRDLRAKTRAVPEKSIRIASLRC